MSARTYCEVVPPRRQEEQSAHSPRYASPSTCEKLNSPATKSLPPSRAPLAPPRGVVALTIPHQRQGSIPARRWFGDALRLLRDAGIEVPGEEVLLEG